MGSVAMWNVAAWMQVRCWLQAAAARVRRCERGQATTEYALVLLGVAAVAMALTTWAGGGKVASFLDSIFERLVAGSK